MFWIKDTPKVFFLILKNFEFFRIKKSTMSLLLYAYKISTKFAKVWELSNIIETTTLTHGTVPLLKRLIQCVTAC